jgi:hypothetical protein
MGAGSSSKRTANCQPGEKQSPSSRASISSPKLSLSMGQIPARQWSDRLFKMLGHYQNTTPKYLKYLRPLPTANPSSKLQFYSPQEDETNQQLSLNLLAGAQNINSGFFKI